MAGRHTIKLEMTLDQLNLVKGILEIAMKEKATQAEYRSPTQAVRSNEPVLTRDERTALGREAMDLKGVIDQL
jgi:hypothetical protein